MKRYFKGFFIALGMFSIIPVPYFDWDDDSMELIMPCLPLVGGVVGGLWWLLSWLLSLWQPPVMIYGAFLALLPFLLTGMLHLDGFMDTMDAALSCRDKPERLRILKDPHMGAFGTAAFGILLLLTFCAGVTIAQNEINPIAFLFIPILSRTMAVIISFKTHPIASTGYMATFYRPHRWPSILALVSIAVATVALSDIFCGRVYVLPLLALVAVSLLGGKILYSQFGGISGDLCGCIITVSEFSAMLGLALI